jgi:hypothetical protein
MNKPPTQLELEQANTTHAPHLDSEHVPNLQAAIERLTAQPGPDDFDWHAGNPDIVIREQPQTAVYENPYGCIVIRQEARDDNDDPLVYFVPENIPALIRRLQEMCK